jgi:23S rRNA (cytosine1962-C5)-methyltransferase
LVDAELFKKIILESAIDAGRDVAVLKELSQGVDHPYGISFPEGRYLKGFLLRIL